MEFTNGIVAVPLVIVEDALDGLDTRVLLSRVGLSGRSLVPTTVQQCIREINTGIQL